VPCGLADPGLWEIEIELVERGAQRKGPEPAPIVLDAWIERDDPGEGGPGERSYFINQGPEDDQDTLSSIATGGGTIVAGGFNRGTGVDAPYGSVGPQRPGIEQRFVLAACEEDDINPTIAAAATRSSEVYRMNGTSVAAPVLARRVFNRLVELGELRNAAPALTWREPFRLDWPRELKKMVDAEQAKGLGQALLKLRSED
jgi:hypothetical protein